jgi:hypothetical protein
MKGASYFALGVGLFTETAIALGQTPSQTVVAQVTGSVPPSGVLITPPPAPVPLPPSGSLATIDRPAVTAVPFTTIQKLRTARKGSSVRSGRQVRHRRPSAYREATEAMTSRSQPLEAKSGPAHRPDGMTQDAHTPGRAQIRVTFPDCQAQSPGLRCGLLNIDGQTRRPRLVEIAPERASGGRGWHTIWFPPCAAPTTGPMALNVKF